MKLSKQSARHTWRSALMAAICAVGFGSSLGTVRAQAQASQPVTIAVVDEDKLADGFSKYQNAIKDLEKRSQGITGQLTARSLLNTDEAKDFDGIVAKPTLSQADQGKVDGYIKTSNDRNAEYMNLNGKVAKSDADNARIKELRDMAAANSDAVGALSDRLYAALKLQQDETDKQFTDQAKEAIVQVAKDRKFTMVVRSRGVIWNIASIDITDDVLKRLNK
jgi:Skp family chaperone for outer membrane proteins